MKTNVWTILAASVVLGACASSPVPAGRLAESESTIRTAESTGVEKVPPAAVHLRVAKDELTLAKKLLGDGDNKRADGMLMRAQADAEVAISLAHEAEMRADAMKTMEEVQRVKASRPGGS